MAHFICFRPKQKNNSVQMNPMTFPLFLRGPCVAECPLFNDLRCPDAHRPQNYHRYGHSGDLCVCVCVGFPCVCIFFFQVVLAYKSSKGSIDCKTLWCQATNLKWRIIISVRSGCGSALLATKVTPICFQINLGVCAVDVRLVWMMGHQMKRRNWVGVLWVSNGKCHTALVGA